MLYSIDFNHYEWVVYSSPSVNCDLSEISDVSEISDLTEISDLSEISDLTEISDRSEIRLERTGNG